jgi:hypothetical protein
LSPSRYVAAVASTNHPEKPQSRRYRLKSQIRGMNTSEGDSLGTSRHCSCPFSLDYPHSRPSADRSSGFVLAKSGHDNRAVPGWGCVCDEATKRLCAEHLTMYADIAFLLVPGGALSGWTKGADAKRTVGRSVQGFMAVCGWRLSPPSPLAAPFAHHFVYHWEADYHDHNDQYDDH